MTRALLRGGIVALLLLTLQGTSHAAWSPIANPITTASGDQNQQLTVQDGSGGFYTTWVDYNSTSSIHIQHMTHRGIVASGWSAGGMLLSNPAHDAADVALVSDGAGGAIVAWADHRNGHWNIYVQRCAPDGIATRPAAVPRRRLFTIFILNLQTLFIVRGLRIRLVRSAPMELPLAPRHPGKLFAPTIDTPLQAT